MNKDNNQQTNQYFTFNEKNIRCLSSGPLAQLVVARVLYTRGRGFEPHMDQYSPKGNLVVLIIPIKTPITSLKLAKTRYSK